MIYIIANTVLSVSPNFPVLLVFRGVQAVGSASTVSIGMCKCIATYRHQLFLRLTLEK